MTRVDLSAEICGLTIEPAIMNASGIFSHLPVLRRLQGSFGALVTKSIGYHERDGFETPVFAQLTEKEYINAVGLPNPGHRAFMEELLEHYPMRRPLIVSIFGSGISEVREMVSQLQYACDAFELNLSCPHPRPGEKVGLALGSDPLAVESFVDAARRASRKPVIAKLSFSMPDLEDSVKACVSAGAGAISATNTIGPVDSGSGRLKWPVLSNLKGGVSGPGIKEHGLQAVRRIRAAAPDVPIIGMGGIASAQDIIDYVKAGADAVAIGTAFDLMDTPSVEAFMNDMLEELRSRLESEGVRSLRGLRG